MRDGALKLLNDLGLGILGVSPREAVIWATLLVLICILVRKAIPGRDQTDINPRAFVGLILSVLSFYTGLKIAAGFLFTDPPQIEKLKEDKMEMNMLGIISLVIYISLGYKELSDFFKKRQP